MKSLTIARDCKRRRRAMCPAAMTVGRTLALTASGTVRWTAGQLSPADPAGSRVQLNQRPPGGSSSSISLGGLRLPATSVARTPMRTRPAPRGRLPMRSKPSVESR